ncbi:hypothetical protein CKO35_12470 [Ectothiorhodospira shaposhnikovii]|uniref:hypothetical protein n=1 Tax=Ectothiorhodospira shaposhnikovii TaxID=1054 RepID=UPI001906937B|nr:hypothetical protein [Ectothiorhodospira shaposhnikovii]MBK1674102.1 hypothetical protein [Ectothiorhodospira shaposhnikovii]
MDRNSVFSKTSKGKAAINNKDRALSIDARRILIMVNGIRTTGELLDQFSGHADVETHLQILLSEEFIFESIPGSGKGTAGTLASKPIDSNTPLSEPLMQLLEKEFIEFMGPMGSLICEEVWPGVATMEEAMEALCRHLDSPEQAKAFRTNVMKTT